MVWHLDADTPLYSQIISNIEVAIASGFYKPGSQIPPVRTLAMEAGVNPNTMQKALSELERMGLVRTERTSGRFITDDKEMILNMKKEVAENEIAAFLEKMKSLGFDKEEVIKIIQEE